MKLFSHLLTTVGFRICKEQTKQPRCCYFDLADGKEFEFSINDSYRNQLVDKNRNIESFFF